MSTEHQKYSTENQSDAIWLYAARRGFEIVQTYCDRGKSGLRLDGRDGLKRLIDDVQNKRAEFEAVLVYDVSRWGRFQDADESAYYEYICKRAGIRVEYCAEQFENDGSPVSTIVKSVKRSMAGEYSRELSSKVFTGQCRLIELGFRQGGPPGYGLRRRLIDQTGCSTTSASTGLRMSAFAGKAEAFRAKTTTAFDPNRTRIDGHAVRLINRSAENICAGNGPLLGNCQALD